MSTRGCIARVEGDAFRGVYHHWDSYPTELGRRLFAIAQGQDIDTLLRELIDGHPGGWLTVQEECFCHDRGEDPMPVAPDENDAWVEWAYAFDARARSMAVLHKRAGEAWRLRALVALDGPAPDWQAMERTSTRSTAG
jgi:hypothetical protein